MRVQHLPVSLFRGKEFVRLVIASILLLVNSYKLSYIETGQSIEEVRQLGLGDQPRKHFEVLVEAKEVVEVHETLGVRVLFEVDLDVFVEDSKYSDDSLVAQKLL